MYRPDLNPGEELVRASPEVTVKNVLFDAFLTNRRIIFAKKTDDLYQKKELVFPLNLVRGYKAAADQSGNPVIEFSIQKPDGGMGDLILKFTQTGEYRYAERDEWIERIERLKNAAAPPQTGMQGSQLTRPQENEPHSKFNAPNVPPAAPVYSRGQPVNQPFAGDPFAQTRPQSQPVPAGDIPPAPPQNTGNGYQKQPSFCRFCGGNIPAGSVFCPSCGKKAAQEAPQNQQNFAGTGAPRPPQPPVQRQYAPPVPPSPPASDPYSQGERNRGYNAPPPGMSLADDPGFSDAKRRGRPSDQRRMPSPDQMDKRQQKAFRQAEKERQKQAKIAEKEHKKAMKRSGGSYDPYGYKESRIPEGLPKVIGIAVAVVVVLAVALYAVNSGMLSGSGTTPAASPSGADATASPTTAAGSDYTPGSTTTSSSFGTWYIQVMYPGEWSGTYSVNGVSTPVSNMGYKKITVENPTGTIVVNVKKTDGGDGKALMVDIVDPKGHPTTESTTAANGEVTVSATVS